MAENEEELPDFIIMGFEIPMELLFHHHCALCGACIVEMTMLDHLKTDHPEEAEKVMRGYRLRSNAKNN